MTKTARIKALEIGSGIVFSCPNSIRYKTQQRLCSLIIPLHKTTSMRFVTRQVDRGVAVYRVRDHFDEILPVVPRAKKGLDKNLGRVYSFNTLELGESFVSPYNPAYTRQTFARLVSSNCALWSRKNPEKFSIHSLPDNSVRVTRVA